MIPVPGVRAVRPLQTEPNPPADPARSCCGWCGYLLNEHAVSAYFDKVECQLLWTAWRADVDPIDLIPRTKVDESRPLPPAGFSWMPDRNIDNREAA